MDRSVYETGQTWGNFSEISGQTPFFHEKKRRGEFLPIHPYSWRRIDGVSRLGMTLEGPRTERSVAGWPTIAGSLHDGWFHTGHGIHPWVRIPKLSDLHQQIRDMLARKLRDTPIDLSVALGEYRSTASMFTGACREVGALLQRVRHHRYKDALSYLMGLRRGSELAPSRQVARRAANAWLGFTYGVKPLLSDMHGAMTALQDSGFRRPMQVVSVRGGAKLQGRCRVVVGQHQTEAWLEGECALSGRILFEIENPIKFELSQLGLTNPLATIWELIPYSFVVDWFVPVGNFLGSVIPPQGVSSVQGYTYVKAKGTVNRKTSNVPGSWYTWNTSGYSREVIKDRVKLSSFPVHTLADFDYSLGLTQITSATALLVQQLTSDNSGKPWYARR